MATQSKSDRPKISIPLSHADYAWETLAALAITFMVGTCLFNYSSLPEQIPAHFGPGGAPDRFGHKQTILIFTAIGIALYALMTWLNRFPHRFNYMQPITQDNAAEQYGMATRVVRLLKMFVMFLFAYLAWGIVSVSNGSQSGLGAWFLPVVLGPVFFIVIGYIWKNSTSARKPA